MIFFLESVNWTQIWVITGVGYSVVFVALVTLIFLFNMMPKVLKMMHKRKLKREGKYIEEQKTDGDYIPGEVNAAIATALSLFFDELHDEESRVITIKRVARTYSPWSSKIYGLRNFSPTKRQ